MILKAKKAEVKMKDGKIVEPIQVRFTLDFSPNHYDLPVTQSVYEASLVGENYELDIKSI